MTLIVCLLVCAPDISILQLLALAMAASAGSQFQASVMPAFSCVGIACVV